MSKVKFNSKIDVLITLKQELVVFFDELIDLLPEEGDLVVVRFFIQDKFPIADIMDHIVENLLPLEDMVKNRDEGFFLNNNILFDKLDENKVNHFKRLWRSDILDDELREWLWNWFRAIIKYAKIYNGMSQ